MWLLLCVVFLLCLCVCVSSFSSFSSLLRVLRFRVPSFLLTETPAVVGMGVATWSAASADVVATMASGGGWYTLLILFYRFLLLSSSFSLSFLASAAITSLPLFLFRPSVSLRVCRFALLVTGFEQHQSCSDSLSWQVRGTVSVPNESMLVKHRKIVKSTPGGGSSGAQGGFDAKQEIVETTGVLEALLPHFLEVMRRFMMRILELEASAPVAGRHLQPQTLRS